MKQVTYIEYTSLRQSSNTEQIADAPIYGTCLVGTEPVLTFEANHSNFGYDDVSLFPAFHKGDRRWLKREEWNAAPGYSAYGTNETIIAFETGVKLFLEHGVFAFPEPTEAK